MKKVLVKLLACVFFGMFFYGCAMHETLPDNEIVRNLAQQRLNVLIAQDYKKAYSFSSPAYRASVPEESHHPKVAGAANWTKGVVDTVECDENACDVHTLISYELPQYGIKNTRSIKQRWIKIKGKWWIYHR